MDLHITVKLKSEFEVWKAIFDRDKFGRAGLCDESKTMVAKVDEKTAMIALFGKNTCVDRLFLYLNAILATVTDPDVIFKYIEVATKCSQFKEVERVTRESIYDPAKVKDFLMGQQLQDPRPLINVCDKHGFLDDLVRYLYASDRMKVIEQYVLEENPKNLPVVAGSLVDLGVEEGVIAGPEVAD